MKTMPESPIYLDASVLVALFSDDPQAERRRAVLHAGLPVVIVSDYAATEFASAIARRVRMGQIRPDDARSHSPTLIHGSRVLRNGCRPPHLILRRRRPLFADWT